MWTSSLLTVEGTSHMQDSRKCGSVFAAQSHSPKLLGYLVLLSTLRQIDPRSPAGLAMDRPEKKPVRCSGKQHAQWKDWRAACSVSH